jgi:hypothetical protein
MRNQSFRKEKLGCGEGRLNDAYVSICGNMRESAAKLT